MANTWLRLWHDMPNDPKWRTISRISGQSISLVQATYIHILVSASESTERGYFTIEAEDIASSLNESDESVIAVISAMQGRVIEGSAILGWGRRQSLGGDLTTPEKATGNNYIYFVVATRSSVATTDDSVVKVAISSNPWARLKDLKKDKSSNFELLAKLKTSARSNDEILNFFPQTQKNGGWLKRSNAINSLIEKIKSKELVNYEQCVSFLSGLPPDSFVEMRSYGGSESVATVATKDTDTDTDTDLKNQRESNAHESSVNNFAGEPSNPPPEPEERKFRMHPDWQPLSGFAERSEGWGHPLGGVPPTDAEIRQFRDYWQPETAHKHHLQWEMALAESLERQRSGKRPTQPRRDINVTGPVDKKIPAGFRGNNPHQDET